MIELYPQGGLMVIHSDKLSDKDKESSTEKMSSQHELFGDILEEKTTLRIDAEGEELQRLKEELAKDKQKNKKLTESLRKALKTLQRLEARILVEKLGEQREEQRKTILNEKKKIDIFP